MTTKNLSPSQLLAAFNKDNKDMTIRAAIAGLFCEMACFTVKNGEIDVKTTLENHAFIVDTEEEIAGALSFDDVIRELATQYEADPLTGNALHNGVTTGRVRVDWKPVSHELRLVAAYAVESGQLPVGATSETVVDALREPLRAPWNRFQTEWKQLIASTKAADQARAIGIRARLVFDKGSMPALAATKKVKVSDPLLQRVLDLNPPAPPVIGDDDLRRRFANKKYIQMDAWGCSLSPEQFDAILHYINGGHVLNDNDVHCLTSRQGPIMNDFARSERGRERIQAIWDALK